MPRRDERRDGRAPRVPSRLQSRVAVQDVAGKPVDRRRIPVTAHETDTGDRIGRRTDQARERILRQCCAGVCPQEPAVTARTVAGTAGDVDGERHLVGKLLKDNICIDIT